MPALFFTNIWMLAGLTALSIPVVIHLLLRRKTKRARFSTVQFFIRQDEQASQRRKLRNWLLLALRLCIFALLVLAFARPYLPAPAAAGAGDRKRQVVVLLDRSLSMQANDLEGSKWTRAKEAAARVLAELKADDRAALVGVGFRAEVLSEWAPSVVVSKVLADLQPTYGAATVTDGLQQTLRLLSVADPAAQTTLCVVGDLQRNSCQNLASYPLSPGTELRIVPIGDLGTPNLAIADLQLEGTLEAGPHVVVVSFSDEDQPSVQLDLTVDGQLVSSGSFSLPAATSTNIEVALPTLKPGWHDVAVQLKSRDALASDNARFHAVFVPEPMRTLVVETREGQRSFEEESFFVSTALDPGRGSTNAVPSRFAFEKVSLEELIRQLAKDGSPLPCDWIVLPGLKQPPAGLGSRLHDYVQSGGGLLLFLGDGVSAIRYNAEFRGLLPATLGALEDRTGLGLAWRVGAYDTNAAIFAPFRLPNSGSLALAEFVKRFSFDAADARQVVARFEDGVPFLLTNQIGQGQIVLANTSADTAWNDWPKHKSFVPWLHGTGQYLAAAQRRAQTEPPKRLATGAFEDLTMGTAAAKASFHLVSPDGKESQLTADEQGTLRDVTLSSPGVYSLRAASGQELRRLVANIPAVESDLTALPAAEVQQQIVRSAAPRQASLAAGLFGSGKNEREIWRLLLCAVLLLLGVEMLIANRTLA